MRYLFLLYIFRLVLQQFGTEMWTSRDDKIKLSHFQSVSETSVTVRLVVDYGEQ